MTCWKVSDNFDTAKMVFRRDEDVAVALDSPTGGCEDEIDHEQFTLLLEWIDEMPLTRVKRNLNRDFSDAVLVAEVIHHQLCDSKVFQLVEKHNYQSANSSENKKANWELLRHKVLRKLCLSVTDRDIQDFISAKDMAMERFLLKLRPCLDDYIKKRRMQQGSSSKDQSHYPTPGYPRAYTKRETHVIAHGGGSNSLNSKSNPAPGNYDALPAWVKMDLSEKEQKLAGAEETIQILSTKVKKLERLVYLKDLRLNQLEKGEGAAAHMQQQYQ
ncbi:sperm flagellar protein 1-like isoform X2 [Convolutriloba macropyga]|uniref:sperm flagellar protein 1-like isoform X2 n=1 Tax=Convolutriloba macropyga TaxID=536237 RepID=UPI003F5219B5